MLSKITYKVIRVRVYKCDYITLLNLKFIVQRVGVQLSFTTAAASSRFLSKVNLYCGRKGLSSLFC